MAVRQMVSHSRKWKTQNARLRRRNKLSAQFENHFNKVLAYLCSNGDTAVLPVNTLGYSAADNTLRLHDGCTRGGRYKLALTERCVKLSGVMVNPKLAPKTPAKVLTFADTVATLTAEKVTASKISFSANWPDYGGEIDVEFALDGEPAIITVQNGDATANFVRAINTRLSQYGLVAVALADTDTSGRLAIKGPKSLGDWELTLTSSDKSTSTTSHTLKG